MPAGSAVRPDKLRFDFTHDHALTAEEREEVERRVNEQVFAGLPVHVFETSIEEAREKIKAVAWAQYDGELVARIPAYPGAGLALRFVVWMRNSIWGKPA